MILSWIRCNYMKIYAIFLILLFAGCASSQPKNKSDDARLSELDAEKYQVIDMDKFDNETTSCGKDKLLRCLDVPENKCYKIYRAAAVDCFAKFYEAKGKGSDLCSPSNKGFIDGCMFENVLKYGNGGILQAKQCMKST